MIQRRTNRAPNSMGSFVPMLGSGYAAPSPRTTCARCKCKLSRYAAQTETMCAPCNAVMHPWTAPHLRNAKRYDDCTCGNKKSVTSMTCVTCYHDRQRAKRRKLVDGRLKARADGLCAQCAQAPHRPRHSLCIACSNKRYRKPAA